VDGNFPYNAPFRACKLPRRQAETGEKALGKRRPNHLFRESRAMTPPPKQPNAARRSREHLTLAEIDRLITAMPR
jgi:hypothetical protein